MGDVRKLREAVEAGRDNSELWRPALGDHGFTGMQAFHGSLDAAKALHDALLPGWRWHIEAKAAVVCRIKDDFTRAGCADNPARAWVIAILRALEGGE
jgi:hypothetical protein